MICYDVYNRDGLWIGSFQNDECSAEELAHKYDGYYVESYL